MKRCANCTFFFADEKAPHCRRYPPQMMVLPGVPDGPGAQVAVTHPRVNRDNWCGEFKQETIGEG